MGHVMNMERSIISTSERWYHSYTYQRVTEARGTGGKVEKTVTEYEDCPLVFVNTKQRTDRTGDGLYKKGTAKVHIAARFFDVYEFSPSIKDLIKKGDIVYRIVDLKDYTYHPHIDVWSVTLERIEYHG